MRRKRGLTRLLIGSLVAGFSGSGSSLVGCGTAGDIAREVLSSDPSSLTTYTDTYVFDSSPVSTEADSPEVPRGTYPYAQKLYLHSENNITRDPASKIEMDRNKEGFENPFFEYAEFSCSRKDPLRLVVGFEREFSHVTISGHWPVQLDVWGAAVSPLTLAGGGTTRFVSNSSRSDEGYAQARPYDPLSAGGEIQLDTGPGSERYFEFNAVPSGDETVIISIDYLQAGG